MSLELKTDRRQFLRSSAMAVVASDLVVIGAAKAETNKAAAQTVPPIERGSVPTITIATDFDGANASGASYRRQFSGKYAHRIFSGFGHNVPQEDPQDFAQAVVDIDSFAR